MNQMRKIEKAHAKQRKIQKLYKLDKRKLEEKESVQMRKQVEEENVSIITNSDPVAKYSFRNMIEYDEFCKHVIAFKLRKEVFQDKTNESPITF